MKQFGQSILVTVCILLLAACGSTNNNQPNTTELTEAQAGNFAKVALQSDDYLIGMLANPMGFSNPLSTLSLSNNPELNLVALSIAALEPQQTDCYSETGSDVDADKDGIPASSVISFDCSSSENGFSYSYKGKITFADNNDADPKSGYSVKIENYEISFNNKGDIFKLSMNLDFSMIVTATSYTAKYTFDFETSGTDASGKIGFDYTYTYTPDNAADPFAAGTLSFTGNMTFTEGSDTVSLTSSSTGVHFSESCKTGFDSGTVNYADNAGNTLKVTFNACDKVTVSYNGSAVTGF